MLDENQNFQHNPGSREAELLLCHPKRMERPIRQRVGAIRKKIILTPQRLMIIS